MRKFGKRFISSVMSLSLVVTIFSPIMVNADGEYILTFTASGEHTMEKVDGHLKIDGQFVDLRNGDNTIGTVDCTSNKNCTITVSDGTPGKLNYNSANKFSLYMQGHEVDMEHSFTFNEPIAVQDYVQQNDPVEPGPEPGEGFDGKAYLIWSCGTGICYHHYDNIPNFDDGNSYFIKESTVTADNNPGQTFSINAQYKGWSTDAKFNNWVTAYKIYKNINENADIDWSTVDPKDMIGDPIDVRQYEEQAISAGTCTKSEPQDVFEACVNGYAASKGVWVTRAQLQPLGEPDDNNAYVSYGDRNFKVVVYNDDYKGVTIGNLSDLNYYPAEWANAFLRQDQFDISDTTKAKPTTINTVLLESTVNIKELNYNGFSINKIEALDVPSNAVSISKVNGEWKLVFASNFYDNVTFKVTDSDGEVSYFNVKRYTVDAWVNNVENAPHLYAELYFDKTKSYTDFELTAKIEYKDGTVENVPLTVYNKIDDHLGNITTAYELDESNPTYGPSGKGLKRSVFIYKLPNGKTDRDIKNAYVNVEYKGSTSTKYAGAFAGSGKGVLANIYHGEED